MMFGGWGNTDHDDSIKIIHKALDAGINSSTPPTCLQGESEGSSARPSRRSSAPASVLATKVHGRWAKTRFRGQLAALIMAEVEHSLKRLKTDYIDLYKSTDRNESTASKRRSAP